MKRLQEKWSFVVAGRWNIAILSPKWVGETIFDQSTMQILFDVTGGTPPKYETDSIRISVTRNRLEMFPLKDEEPLLQKIEDSIVKVLSILKYTPITAFGQNFHYRVSSTEAPEEIEKLFRLTDDEKIASVDMGTEIRTEIIRSIREDDRILNMKLARTPEYDIALNFHYNVNDADRAAKLMKNTYVANKNLGLELLESVYGLKCEEDAK